LFGRAAAQYHFPAPLAQKKTNSQKKKLKKQKKRKEKSPLQNLLPLPRFLPRCHCSPTPKPHAAKP
jgi:hypothetical protein